MNTVKENPTETHRKAAVIVGILFIIATAFLFIGGSFYGPVLDTPDFLETAYPNRIAAAIGILIEFSCVLAIPLIPIFAYPVIRKHSVTFALSYVVFRLFEAVLFILVDINKLSLINVSQGYLAAGPADAPFFQNLGGFIQSWNLWGWCFYVLVFAIGALIFYTALYQSRLVPRWISGWGLLAAAMIFLSGVFPMLEIEPNFLGAATELVFVLPIAVQEMVLAGWLILKGFNPSAIAAMKKPITA
jgi:hypothetical protein